MLMTWPATAARPLPAEAEALHEVGRQLQVREREVGVAPRQRHILRALPSLPGHRPWPAVAQMPPIGKRGNALERSGTGPG